LRYLSGYSKNALYLQHTNQSNEDHTVDWRP